MSKPVGGRGKRASYTTSVVRVPDPIKQQVEKLVTAFYEGVEEGDNYKQIDLLDLHLAINEARRIIRHKKSARLSMEMLLEVLYKTPVNL
jgi:hypothetical protein